MIRMLSAGLAPETNAPESGAVRSVSSMGSSSREVRRRFPRTVACVAVSHPDVTQSESTAVDNVPAEGGRLAILSVFAGAVSAIPLPFVPDRLVARVRGAVVHDVASRHGRTLTPEGRQALCNPAPAKWGTALAKRALLLATKSLFRRVGPLAAIGAGVSVFEVFALGHLFERYLTEVRAISSVRIDSDEANRLREVVDRAVMRVTSPGLTPRQLTLGGGAEDLRGSVTRWVDTLLLGGAAVPDYVVRRLDSAFDEVARETPGFLDRASRFGHG